MIPLLQFVFDELILQRFTERRLDERIAAEHLHRLQQVLRQKINAARLPLLLADGI